MISRTYKNTPTVLFRDALAVFIDGGADIPQMPGRSDFIMHFLMGGREIIGGVICY